MFKNLPYSLVFLWLLVNSFTYSVKAADSTYFDLGLNYGYQRQVYGARREAKFTSETYSGTLAWYIFTYTALEVNYSYTQQDIVDSTHNQLDADLELISSYQRVVSQVYGGGIRQMLAPRGFFVVPMVSVGYAKQFQQTSEQYILKTTSTAEIREVIFVTPKHVIDSAYATFALQFNLTQTLKVTGSVTTVFKWFETDKAKDNVRYLAGISWLF